MKRCSNKNCKQNNPQELINFSKDSKTKDGYHSSCKHCRKIYENLESSKLKRRKYNREYNHRPERKQINRIKSLNPKYKQYHESPNRKFKDYQKNSKARGINFDLTLEQFIEVINKDCTYCGEPGPNGVDRRDNTKGYILENSVPCCTVCNHMKWDLSVSKMYAHIKKMIKHHSSKS